MSTNQTTPVNQNMFNSFDLAVQAAEQVDERITDVNHAIRFRPAGVSGLEVGDEFIIDSDAIFRDKNLSKPAELDPADPTKVLKPAVDVVYAIAKILVNSPDVLRERETAKVYLSAFDRHVVEYTKSETGQLVSTGRHIATGGTFADYLDAYAAKVAEVNGSKHIPLSEYCGKRLRVVDKVRVTTRNFAKTELITRNVFSFDRV